MAALDDWAFTRRELKRDGWKQRLAVARAADPDPLRQQLRDALERKNPKALDELARSDQAADWPATTLVLLGRLAYGTPSGERVAALLARAQQRRPGDFWVNETLGMLLYDSRPRCLEGAIRYYTAALALRPRSPGAHLNLGLALQQKRQVHEAIAEFREAIRVKNDYAEAHYSLGLALENKGQLDEVIAEYREAIRLKKDFPEAHGNLGNALRHKGQLDEAIAEFREALKKEHPEDYIDHLNLGVALRDKGRLDEAIAEFREALRLKKDYPDGHTNLGSALVEKGRVDEAFAEYREAIRLKKDYAEAHVGLGVALHEKRQLDEAIAEYREAIRLKKDFPEAHNNLGNALSDKGQLDEAIAEYGEAIRIKKDSPLAHNGLGCALAQKGLLDQAIAEFREALRLKRDYCGAHNNLGNVFKDKGQLDEAVAEFEEALRLKKDSAGPHTGLGSVLLRRGQLDEAIGEYREAIRLKKDSAEAHYGLGLALLQQGRFREAVAELRIGHELGSRRPGWPYPSAERLRTAEHMADVDARLPGLLKGKDQPKDAGERLALAQMCQMHKKLYAAAARWYGEAFAAEPALAEKLGTAGGRYDAACAAALAGCGQGQDAAGLPDKERARLRQQSLDWLKDDLRAWSRLLETQPEKAGPVIAQQMAHWLEDSDFAGVRGDKALAKLPESERHQWQKLWAEVAELGKRAAASKPEVLPMPREVK